jgi:hypothetical protein
MPVLPRKPQGRTGPVSVSSQGCEWQVIPFPPTKADRELVVANMFVAGFNGYVANQSEPSLAPFAEVVQNEENDLDFTLVTSQGPMRMDLAEFAPLREHGPRFENAPLQLHPTQKVPLALELILSKSAHQGGRDRLLVLYNTEQAFWLDPVSIEKLRRKLSSAPPNFERVYFVSPHNLTEGSVSEIYPGKPHHMFGELSDEAIGLMRTFIPHPTQLEPGFTVDAHWRAHFGAYGEGSVQLRINAHRLSRVKV